MSLSIATEFLSDRCVRVSWCHHRVTNRLVSRPGFSWMHTEALSISPRDFAASQESPRVRLGAEVSRSTGFNPVNTSTLNQPKVCAKQSHKFHLTVTPPTSHPITRVVIHPSTVSPRLGKSFSVPIVSRQGWDAVQRLVNLDPDHGGKAQRNDSRAQLVRMNLAALVVPCVISCVCVLVGLMTLNEYCLFAGDGDGDASAAFAESVPHSPQKRCFRHGDQEGLASTVSRFDFAHETRILSYAKIAAVSFYAASLLPTAMSVAFPGGKVGPLKKSLALYHILICVWSVFYYTLDFFEFVPLVRSDRDGQLEYSAVRVSISH
jgi:hypothetical protein